MTRFRKTVSRLQFALAASAIFAACPVHAAAEPTVAEMERQRDELDSRIKARKIADAKRAIADAATAAARATEARHLLAELEPGAPELKPATDEALRPPALEQAAVIAAKAASATPGTVATISTKTDGTAEVKIEPLSQEGMRDGNGKQKFGGIEFGVGVAFTYDLGKHNRIREASVVNGVIRVSNSDNVKARLVLESHYFFTPEARLPILGIRNAPGDVTWGWGPFVALQPGSDAVIDAIGAGLMVGFRRSDKATDSFNIGIGVMYDIDSNVLGDGLYENQPLPAGEKDIRFKQREQSGFLIMTSYSF